MSDETPALARECETRLYASLEGADGFSSDLASLYRELASFREDVLERLDRLEASLDGLAIAWRRREAMQHHQNADTHQDPLIATWEAAWEVYRTRFGQEPPITLAELQSDMLVELALWLRAAVDRGRPWTADRLRRALGLPPELPREVKP